MTPLQMLSLHMVYATMHQLLRRSRRRRSEDFETVELHAGPDKITPELLKTAELPISTALYQLFQLIWKSGKVLADWKEAVSISLFAIQGEGPRTNCSSYRPISLLSVPGKVFTFVLLTFATPTHTSAETTATGFTRSRSTTDAILMLRYCPG